MHDREEFINSEFAHTTVANDDADAVQTLIVIRTRRFIEEAKKLGVDESGEKFRLMMDTLVAKKPKGGSS